MNLFTTLPVKANDKDVYCELSDGITTKTL